MSNVLPSEAIANEVFGLEATPKAMLLNELTDTVLEAQEGFKVLNLSSDATQWVKSLTIIDTLTIIECLAHSIKSSLMLEPIEQKIAENEQKIDELLGVYEFCPCGDMGYMDCRGECGYDDDDREDCHECGGTGHHDESIHVPCMNCNGSGKQPN